MNDSIETHEHALFRRFPLTGSASTSRGSFPVPYHVYEGFALFVGGTAELDAARALLAGEAVQPVQTRSGRAVVGAWICNFTRASMGPHTELQVSVYVTEREAPPLDDHPLSLLDGMVRRNDLLMRCHGLWNDDANVVTYNRELLGLDAALARSRMQRSADSLAFNFEDAQSGAPLAQGQVMNPARRSLACDFALAARLGPGALWRLSRNPTIRVRIMGGLDGRSGRVAVANSYTHATSVLHRYDAGHERFVLQAPRYQALQFRPNFVQFMDPFRFVYQLPA
jgi:hypothetical protein